MPWVSEQLKKVSGGQCQPPDLRTRQARAGARHLRRRLHRQGRGRYSWMGYEAGKVPASQLFGAVPFGMESPQFAAWIYFGGGDALLKEVFKPHNVYPIFCGTISPEAAGGSARRSTVPTTSRASEIPRRRAGRQDLPEARRLGDPVPGGELFQALEKGVLDATEFSLPHGGRSARIRQGGQALLPAGLAPALHQPVSLRQLRPGTSSSRHPSPDRDDLRGRRAISSPRPRRCRARPLPSSRRKVSPLHQFPERARRLLERDQGSYHRGGRPRIRCSRRFTTAWRRSRPGTGMARLRLSTARLPLIEPPATGPPR